MKGVSAFIRSPFFFSLVILSNRCLTSRGYFKPHPTHKKSGSLLGGYRYRVSFNAAICHIYKH